MTLAFDLKVEKLYATLRHVLMYIHMKYFFKSVKVLQSYTPDKEMMKYLRNNPRRLPGHGICSLHLYLMWSTFFNSWSLKSVTFTVFEICSSQENCNWPTNQPSEQQTTPIYPLKFHLFWGTCITIIYVHINRQTTCLL